VVYDDSTVAKYVLSLADNDLCPSNALIGHISNRNQTSVGESVSLMSSLSSDHLSAVYSMNVHSTFSSLLLAGGKGGNLVVFRLGNDSLRGGHDDLSDTKDVTGPVGWTELVHFHGHDRWISNSKFVSGNQTRDSILVISSSDDGFVKVWDLSKTCCVSQAHLSDGSNESLPLLLAKSNCSHTKGIFAMDEFWGTILTGSKDKNVAISVMRDNGSGSSTTSHALDTLRTFDYHSRVVKCVAWKYSCCDDAHSNPSGEPVIFASASQDGDVCIKDSRVSSSDPEISITDAHIGGTHSVSWCKSSAGEHLLLSAGYESIVNVYDIRNIRKSDTSSTSSSTSSALHSFPEHVVTEFGSGQLASSSNNRSKKTNLIVSPCFLNSSTIIQPSVRSNSLSVQSITTGKTMSRVILPDSPVGVIATCIDENKPMRNNPIYDSNRDCSYYRVFASTNMKGNIHEIIMRC
jgi:hypothetical protein